MSYFSNDNYKVVDSEHSNKPYEVVNLKSNKVEVQCETMPEAVGAAIGLNYTLNKLMRGEVLVADGDDDLSEQLDKILAASADEPKLN